MGIRFRAGEIVYVSQVPDQNNTNPKDRPVVLLADVADEDTVFYGVAITGDIAHPRPSTHVELPFHREKRCKTKLTKPSVAACEWGVNLSPDRILHKDGFVPPIQLLQILELVGGMDEPASEE